MENYKESNTKISQKILLIFFFALCIRIFLTLLAHSGQYIWGDTVNYVRHWFKEFYDNGVINAYAIAENKTPLDYPPLYYISNYLNTQVYSGILLAIFPILIDLVFIFFLAKKVDWKAALIWSAFPAVLVNVCDMAQSDGLFCALIILLLYSYNKNKPPIAISIIYAFMCLTKLQGIYFLPVYLYMLINTKRERNEKLTGLFAGVAVGLLGWAPFMLTNKDIFLPFKIYLGGVSKTNQICYNASNPYYFLPDKYFDGFMVIVSYILIALCTCAFLAVLKSTNNDVNIASFVYMFFIFFFTFQQHDRYEIYSFAILLFAFFTGSKYVSKNMLFFSFIATSMSALGGWANYRLTWWNTTTGLNPETVEFIIITIGFTFNILLFISTGMHFSKFDYDGKIFSKRKEKLA